MICYVSFIAFVCVFYCFYYYRSFYVSIVYCVVCHSNWRMNNTIQYSTVVIQRLQTFAKIFVTDAFLNV